MERLPNKKPHSIPGLVWSTVTQAQEVLPVPAEAGKRKSRLLSPGLGLGQSVVGGRVPRRPCLALLALSRLTVTGRSCSGSRGAAWVSWAQRPFRPGHPGWLGGLRFPLASTVAILEFLLHLQRRTQLFLEKWEWWRKILSVSRTLRLFSLPSCSY